MRSLALLLVILAPVGCGYNLRGDTRPFFDSHHIKTIYVTPVKNNSYKAGVEIGVYNALRRQIAKGGYVQIVDDPNLADASFSALVNDASYIPLAITTADQLQPINSGPNTTYIASSYLANLRVKFILKSNAHGAKGDLWSQELVRSKSFQASTYLGPLGDTSALVNESEFERTLDDLYASIVTDAEESINSLF
jgi:hypothetical protein